MAYQLEISSDERIWAWLGARPADEIEAVLAWLPRFVEDPIAGARQVERGTGNPGLKLFIRPIPGTPGIIEYWVVEQFRTIRVRRVVTSPIDDLPLPPFD